MGKSDKLKQVCRHQNIPKCKYGVPPEFEGQPFILSPIEPVIVRAKRKDLDQVLSATAAQEKTWKKGAGYFSEREYDVLNNLKSGKYTKWLVDALGETIVQCGIRVFRIMRQLQGQFTPLSRDDIDWAGQSLKIPCEELIQILQKDLKTQRRIQMGALFQYKRGRAPDFPLNILVRYLGEHLKIQTGRKHISWIGSFLAEQEIYEQTENSSISRFFDRYSLDQLEMVFTFFQEVCTVPDGNGGIASALQAVQEQQRAVSEKIIDQRNALFPCWEDFMPF